MPTTTISSIDRDAVINYLNSLEVISEYLEGNVPYTNPDVGYGPIEENYLLYDKEEGDIYFIDTQGYNYPRYITRLAGYKPKGSEEFKSGGGVGKKSILNELLQLKKDGVKNISLNGFTEHIDYVINLKLDDSQISKVDEKSYITLYAKGGGVGSQFEYTIGGL